MIAEPFPSALVGVGLDYGLIFMGTQSGYGWLPDLWLFTDMPDWSPSHGATIAVPVGCPPAGLAAKVEETRAKFTVAAAQSWGGPEGFDSGFDYARA